MLHSHNTGSFLYRIFKASHREVCEACPENGLAAVKTSILAIFFQTTFIFSHPGKI